jgi:exopolysaccharide biosynthesis polyprenyl glycosylphosphotransferase
VAVNTAALKDGAVGSAGSLTLGASTTTAPVRLSRARVRRREAMLVAVTVFTDLIAVVGGYLLSHRLRVEQTDGLAKLNYGRLVLTVPVWLLIFAAYDLYDTRKLAAASEEARRLLHAVVVSVVSVVLLAFILGLEISRTWIAFIAVSCLLFTGVGRVAMRHVVSALRARSFIGNDSIVVGTNSEGRTIARSLGRERSLGYNVIGFVSVGNCGLTELDGRKVLGTVDDLVDLVRENDAAAVIVAGSALEPGVLETLDRGLRPLDVDVRVSPGLPHMAATRITVNAIDGVALLTLEKKEFSWRQNVSKRAFDLLGATLMTLVSLPVMAVIAAAIRITSGPGVLFRQQRVGVGGRIFTIYKFRTMVRDAEHLRTHLVDANEADGLLFKMAVDPRVTRLGRRLRPLGLDELPQLWNVIKGDMSIVGPRPALPEEVEQYDERLRERLSVKPGLTGLWQIKGRHELSFDDYARYDLFYVENWSLSFDLYVIASTIPALLRRRGSY